MERKLTDTFIIDACRQLHPECNDVEAVASECLRYRGYALLKAKHNVDNKDDVEMYYYLKKVKDFLVEEHIGNAYRNIKNRSRNGRAIQ